MAGGNGAAKSGEYEFPPIADPHTGAIDPNAQALDSQISDALSAGGVPKMWGGPICEIAGELPTKRFERSSADEIGEYTPTLASPCAPSGEPTTPPALRR